MASTRLKEVVVGVVLERGKQTKLVFTFFMFFMGSRSKVESRGWHAFN